MNKLTMVDGSVRVIHSLKKGVQDILRSEVKLKPQSYTDKYEQTDAADEKRKRKALKLSKL